jgi:hypothetical protein
MQAEYYKEGIAVFGNTKPWKENLKAIGGSFNGNLEGRAGWIFRKSDEPTVMQLIANANAGAIQPMTAAPPRVGAVPVAQPQMVPMGLAQPALTPAAAMTRLTIAQPQAARVPVPAPAPVVQASLLTLGFPTAAKTRDGLVYQIVMYTVPMPTVGQRITLRVGEAELPYAVSDIVAAAPPAPITEALIRQVLPPQRGLEEVIPEPQTSRIVIAEGVWQVQGLHDAHTVTFLPMQ